MPTAPFSTGSVICRRISARSIAVRGAELPDEDFCAKELFELALRVCGFGFFMPRALNISFQMFPCLFE
jgi:hypothetical protein